MLMTIHTPMQGVPGSTTQAEFTDGDYIIPKSHPAHLRASQTFHRQSLISLLPLISTPALCLLSLLHHPTKHLSVLFPISSTLPPARFRNLGKSPMVQTPQATALPQTKLPPPSAALQSSLPGAHTEESEATNLTQKEKPHRYCKITACTEQLPQSK